MRVFVLLFNARTDNEGIHTIQTSGRDKVLMFKSEDDAARFALMLEAQDFPTPTVEAIDSEEIEEFCHSAGYDWELVEEGMLALPPEKNLEETNWKSEGKKPEPEPESDTSDSELERIRRQLEGLL